MATIAKQGEVFYEIPISSVSPGTYKYVRSSLTYQNYEVPIRSSGLDLKMTLASFVGYNTYIGDFVVKTKTHTVNDDKLQGYWIVEVDDSGIQTSIDLIEGQASNTTVPNPIHDSSPIPPGSCVVTGEFPAPLTITGTETEDITITLSVSTNKSFEFKDALGDGIYEPSAGDTVVDMGVRGLIPTHNK